MQDSNSSAPEVLAVVPAPLSERIWEKLTELAHSSGKMEGMLSRALAGLKAQGERIKTLEESAAEHASRITSAEANIASLTAENNARATVQASHATKLSTLEKADVKNEASATAYGTMLKILWGVIGGGLALVVKDFAAKYMGH